MTHEEMTENYENLTSEQKKEFVKNEIIRKRRQFRGEEPRNGLSFELTKAFASLACRLSPENLYADGECNETQATAEKQLIMNEWRELERRANRTVGKEEFPY